ncbi:MAG: TIGR03936 family radical SAM-associated protein [Anaerovoracaceae bacterium]
MAKYIIKFSKKGYIKFTSHLDMIRLFKRAFKKSEIRLKYSQGFNPHPKMTFAQPLSLGYSSEGEVLEIETKEEISCTELIDRLQNVMPIGIKILSCDIVNDQEKSFASTVDESTYKIEIEGITNFNLEKIHEFVNQDEIIVKKRKKKRKHEFRDVNIKDKIRNISWENYNDNIIMYTKLDAGSESNLNPDLLLEAFFHYFGIDKNAVDIEITRIELKCK